MDPFAGYRNSRDVLFNSLDRQAINRRRDALTAQQLQRGQQDFDLGQLRLQQAEQQIADQQQMRTLGKSLQGKSPLEQRQAMGDALLSQGDLKGAMEVNPPQDAVAKFQRARALIGMVGLDQAKKILITQGESPEEVANLDNMKTTPEGHVVIDAGAGGKVYAVDDGTGNTRFFQMAAPRAATISSWSDPFLTTVGGKEIMVQKDLSSGQVRQVAAGSSSGTMGSLSEAEQEQAEIIGNMIANGEAAPGQIPKRGKVWTAAVAIAKQKNPKLNIRTADADFSLAKNPAFRNRALAASTLPEVLGKMVEAGKEVDFSDIRLAGRAQKLILEETNDPKLTKYMAIRNDGLMEIASVMRMSGVTDAATELENEAAHPTMSPDALDAWLDGQLTSLTPRLERFSKIINPLPSLRIGSEYQGKKVKDLGWDKSPGKDGKIIAKRVALLDDGTTVEISDGN